jgi:fatty acid desaturase
METTSKQLSAKWLTKEELVDFSRVNTSRVILGVALNWLLILLILEAAILSGSWLLYPLAFFLIACCQNALTLWTHEATHYNLTRAKGLNDKLGDIFIAGPIGLTIGQYRWHHVPHHLYLNDPEREVNPLAWICIRGKSLFVEIAQTMIGMYGLRAVSRYGNQNDEKKFTTRPRHNLYSLAGFLAFNGGLFALCVLQGHWYTYFVLWVLPLFTLTLLIGNLRTIVEHQPSSDVCDTGMVQLPAITRVIQASWVERILFAPVGLYFHHEHHLYPAVPFHRLWEVRNVLEARGYFDQPDIVRSDGYIQTIWKLARVEGYGLRLLNPLYEFEHEH